MTAPASASRPRFSPTALALVLSIGLAGMIFLTFGRALEFEGAILDDGRNLLLNPHVGSFSPTDVGWALQPDLSYVPRYMPLGWLGIDLQLVLFGLSPFSRHLVLLVLHGVNSIGLGWVILRFLRAQGFSLTHRTVWSAFLAAALHALHPLRAELAAWSSCAIWQRPIALLLLWAWFRTGRRPRPVAEAITYLISLLFYPVGLGLAPGLFLSEGLVSGWRASWRRNLPILAVAAACGAVTVIIASHGAPSGQAAAFPLIRRLLQALAIEGRAIGALFVPLGLNPYVQPLDRLMAGNPVEIAGAIGLTFAALFSLTKNGRPLRPWIVVFVFLVAPFTWVTSWQNPQIPDRYFAPAHLLLAFGLGYLLARQKGPTLAVVTGLAVIGAQVLAHEATRIWRDEAALFTAVEANLDRSDTDYVERRAFMHYHLALDLYDRGQHPEALAAIAEAVAAAPGNAAYRSAERAMRAGETHPSPTVIQHQQIVSAALAAGETGKAQMHIAEIQRLDPGFYTRPQGHSRP